MDSTSGMIVGGIAVIVVLGIGFHIWFAIVLSAAFKRRGDSAWTAWMPIANAVALRRIGGLSALAAIPTGHARESEPAPARARANSLPPVTWAGRPLSTLDLPVSPSPSGQSLPPAPFGLSASDPYAAPAAPTAPSSSVEHSPWAPPINTVPGLILGENAQPGQAVADHANTASADADQPSPNPAFVAALPSFGQPAPDRPSTAPPTFAPPSFAPPSFDHTTTDQTTTDQTTTDQTTTDQNSAVADGDTIITGHAPLDDLSADPFDATVIAARRVPPWIFETNEAQKVVLTETLVLLGRNPSRSSLHGDAQLIQVSDSGKTVSKTHAQIELVGGTWTITDLHSTNGVILKGHDGQDVELEAGASANLTEDFVLGELQARIYQERN